MPFKKKEAYFGYRRKKKKWNKSATFISCSHFKHNLGRSFHDYRLIGIHREIIVIKLKQLNANINLTIIGFFYFNEIIMRIKWVSFFKIYDLLVIFWPVFNVHEQKVFFFLVIYYIFMGTFVFQVYHSYIRLYNKLIFFFFNKPSFIFSPFFAQN